MTTYSAAIVPAEFLKVISIDSKILDESPKKRKKISPAVAEIDVTKTNITIADDTLRHPEFDSESGTGVRPVVSYLSPKSYIREQHSEDDIHALKLMWKSIDNEYFQPYTARTHRMNDLVLVGDNYGVYT